MLLKQKIEQMIEGFDESELRQIAEFMTFVKFRSRFRNKALQDDVELARLYREFAETDRMEANEGMQDYQRLLSEEDAS